MNKGTTIEELLECGYDEAVARLLEKYGPAKYDYFVDESCKEKNWETPRSAEGLECHHIDEDKAQRLGNSQCAIMNPFEYQKAERLVYCNLLEHLLLHVKIFEKTVGTDDFNMFMPLGLQGIMTFMHGKISDIYGGKEPAKAYERKAAEVISYGFDDYIAILRYLIEIARDVWPPILHVTALELSKGSDGNVVQRVYDALTK